MNNYIKFCIVFGFLLNSSFLFSETLKESVDYVLKTHPDILSSKSEYRNSLYQINQIDAGYLPSIDFSGKLGQQKLDSISTRQLGTDNKVFSPYNLELSLKQNIFNGFKTSNKKLGAKYDAVSKHFDLISTKNLLVLKTSDSFLNIIKNRNLLDLAKENLDIHEKTFVQIKKMYIQGLSSESDLSQIEGRLAQAQTFVLSAEQNLDDALNKYLSIVNKTAHDLEEPEEIVVPFESAEIAISKLDDHPLIRSSKEKINIAKSVYEEGKSSFYPSLDLSVTHNRKYDQNATIGHEEDMNVLLTMGYNLFRGGADKAIINSAATQLEAAYAENSNVYRNLLLELKKNWNELETLNAKKIHILSYEENSSKTLESYKKQFNIGQRTLLDVLNSANELFQARRNLVSLYYDMMYAKLKVINSTGINIYN